MSGRIPELSRAITDGGDTILHFAHTNESLEEYYLSKVDHNDSEDTKRRNGVINRLSGRGDR